MSADQHKWLGGTTEDLDDLMVEARRPTQPSMPLNFSSAALTMQQQVLPTASVDEVFCDFGPLPVQSLCEWRDGCGALEWNAGTGLASNWLGGPPTDSTSGSMEGGSVYNNKKKKSVSTSFYSRLFADTLSLSARNLHQQKLLAFLKH